LLSLRLIKEYLFNNEWKMEDYQNSPNELLRERQRLHDLIKMRIKEGLQAVAEMSKRQLSLEQRLGIIKANNIAAAGL
jgi:hypothetical protein